VNAPPPNYRSANCLFKRTLVHQSGRVVALRCVLPTPITRNNLKDRVSTATATSEQPNWDEVEQRLTCARQQMSTH
jgi:hypothetical protein